MSDLGQLDGLAVVLSRLDVYAEGLKSQALLAAQDIAEMLQQYAVQHHPWQIQTGDTNRTTLGTVIDGGEIIEIYLSAGMDYDLFLELAKAGKWAWLWPTLTANRYRIQQKLVKYLGAATVQGVRGGDVTEF